MKTEKRILGDIGEEAATLYLKKQHYRIRERNFICGKNEVDIIAENRDHIIFAEVKTRTYNENNIERFGRPRCAVDGHKRRCLLAAATAYLEKTAIKKRVRFDVLEVYVTDTVPPSIQEVHHIPDAFRN